LKDRQHNGQKKKTKDKHDVMLKVLWRVYNSGELVIIREVIYIYI
jgi:hypothetical protein